MRSLSPCPSRLAARRGLTVMLAALGLPGVFAASASATAATASGPACKDIRGDTLGLTRTWRVLRLPAGPSALAPLVACRLADPAPAPVRVLASSKLIDDQGEDSESPAGGPYVGLDGLQRSRAVLFTRTFGAGASGTTGYRTLVDLDRGAQVRLPGDDLQDSRGQTDHHLIPEMTAAGGLFFAESRTDGSATSVGAWSMWDSRGLHPLGVAPAAYALSRGSAAAGPAGGTTYRHRGLYVRDAAGQVSRIDATGAADLSGQEPDSALAWQSLTLRPFPRSAYRRDYSGEPIQAASTIASSDAFGGLLWLDYSTSSADPAATVRVLTDPDGEDRLATLAPRSIREFRILASGYRTALVIGRFTDHPRERRVRLFGAGQAAGRFLAQPARTGMTGPGRAAVGDRAFATANASTIRYWAKGRGQVIRVKGAQDLALAEGASAGLFFTDDDGTPRYQAAR